jgi:cytochrome c-type biogenesis protein
VAIVHASEGALGKRRAFVLLAALLLVITCRGREGSAVATAKEPPATSTVATVGAQMPEYSATSLDGTPFRLASRRGEVVFLNLWATWCGPCRFEIPELEKLHARYRDRGFSVIGVSVDEGGADVVRAFLKETPIGYPIVLDPEGRLATLLDTTTLPTSAIIDRSGKVVWKEAGVVSPTDAALVEALEKALR